MKQRRVKKFSEDHKLRNDNKDESRKYIFFFADKVKQRQAAWQLTI